MPSVFRPANIRFTSQAPTGRSLPGRDLLLFSGGVDSTYNLLRRHRAGLKQDLLTVHGLDYRMGDDCRFENLIEKTNPIVQATGSSERLLIRTSLFQAYQREKISHIGILHGFVLAACLFLVRSDFRSGEISADYSREQEPLVFPWGTNSITNKLFANSTFRMETACLDVTRSEKMQALSDSPEALSSLTFCRTYDVRPHNCGLCSKCIRTKAMFLATTGTIPAIFNELQLPPDPLALINLGSPSERAFFLDLASTAEARGTTHLIPGLRQRFAKLRRPPSEVTVFVKKQAGSMRKRLVSATRLGRRLIHGG
jgi:7-cyano-7-deazaguanine synthase in queuosine biosynthesis